jgi:hypothetical protein
LWSNPTNKELKKMGSQVIKRPVYMIGGVREKIQTLTGASTGTTIHNEGVTVLTVAAGSESVTAASYVYTLESPVLPGVHKWILCSNASTRIIQVRTPTSTEVIYATTANAVQWSTGSTDAAPMVELLSLSTTQWAVLNIGTTSIALVGATA